VSAQDPPRRPADLAHSGRASLPEGEHATDFILRRLRAHGAQESRYRERGEVARGGMGAILRVWDEDLRRELAMKVVLTHEGAPGELSPKLLGRFLEEAQVTGQLDHPGIVPVHELGIDASGRAFFTMRLVKGRDLKEIFESVRTGDPEWNLTRALWAMLKVCDAMAYAHSKGVVHRDLKPANVMVGRFGEVYVMDWGLARVQGQPDRHDLRLRREDSTVTFVESERRADASHSADSVLFTMDGDVVGTPAYMAPEQARGEIERLGPRSDVYSVGAMLYHLLSGRMPYVEPDAKVSQHMVLRWTLEGPPRPVRELAPSVPEELVAICEKAMERDLGQRYADMGELGADLRAYLENRVVKAHRTGAWVELVKWVQRNRALAGAYLAIGVAVLAGLGGTLVVEARGRREANRARDQAQASEREARVNLEEAQRQEGIARRERANVLRLSAFQELDDLERAADRLWPARPERMGEYEAWTARARKLIAGLEPSADGTDPGHRRQLAELAARGRALTAEEREAAVRASSRGPELEQAERKVAALRAAVDRRAGRAPPAIAKLTPDVFTLTAEQLNERAGPLVDPARHEFGNEPDGLALARLALEKASGTYRASVADTLAWALLANGLDEEALSAVRDASDELTPSQAVEYENFVVNVARAVEVARIGGDEAALHAAEAELAELEREVLGGPALRFADAEDSWWHDQLGELVARLERLADPHRGLLEGTSPEHGWGIEVRRRFAGALELRSRSGNAARELWSAASASIRDRDECPAYGGLELAPQLGLVPIGRDPDSGLWEFADLQTGDAPRRGPDGRLELGDGSGVVFVLVPGGSFEMGSQPADPARPNFDPKSTPQEQPVNEVALKPFFLSKYEMTQGQWRRFTGRNPSKYLAGTRHSGRELTELSPVEQVSWREATRQLARLGWLLPTEAQWECAARGGAEWPWWAGEDVSALEGVANLADRFASEQLMPFRVFDRDLDDGYAVESPVGSFEANGFGLHDVLGNVFEWCRDPWGVYRDAAAGPEGLRPVGDVALHPVRGGSYVSAAAASRSASRDSGVPELQNEALGLRPMRAIDP